MYKLAIFDLDGTLLNTIDDLAVAMNHALRLGGFPEHPVEAYCVFVGNGVRVLAERVLPPDSRSQEQVNGLIARFDAYYALHSQDCTRPYDGIPEALAALQAAGTQVAVLSNKVDGYVGQLVEQYFPGLVDVAVGQREGVPLKPDPAAVHEILRQMDCEKEDCIYIGDTGTDMDTGRSAGLTTIGVTWGFRTRQELESHDANYIIDKVSQLTEIIVDNSAKPAYT